jgi:hypothetical protein
MSEKLAFAEAIRIIVAKEVDDALVPFRQMLASLIEFAGGAQEGSAAASAGASVSRRSAARVARPRSAASLELVSKFVEGQKVQYRQGRGTFEARVVGIDAMKGNVTLERMNDRKTVVRPAEKVIAA